ncbi:folate-binding protein YgfZ [Agreia sp. Leaf283]|uniref:CAF17-like 4Fe-4S cluster assembly/insertion protein YgfZ n=1 Tax=Agreia sp. Leaf283 TaxID=1736321 RepID=UPI0006F5DF69|nr:folate-binding protein YgfZ [Agreia sp. Leaf283]KQP57812.1 aminomethyltransferase [Agreia sp. Leaf283]
MTSAPSPFLGLPGAVDSAGADKGVPAHYGNPVAEQRTLLAGAIVDLSHRGVISVSGADRLTWLNSLTSQSLTRLAPGQSTESLLLGVSGRVEFDMRVVDDGDTAWLLVDADELPGLLAWLLKMRFTLRVIVSDRTADFATLGSIGESNPVLDAVAASPNGVALVWRDPWSAVSEGGHQYAQIEEHPGAEWLWRETLVARDELVALADRARAGEVAVAGVLAAEALRIAAWRPRRATEGDEKTIPHELDWMRSAVHLSKGCYRGQETVAKVHNLGHPPRRLVFLHLDGTDNVLPAPGDDVVLPALPDAPAGGEPDVVGQVTSSGIHYELGPVALAVVRRSTPVDRDLGVLSDGIVVAAGQEVIVPPEAGSVVGRIRRMPRLGVMRR